jgi:hypothetical protein
VTNGLHLYEVIAVNGAIITLENCRTGYKLETYGPGITTYSLVKPAPTPPDYPVNLSLH